MQTNAGENSLNSSSFTPAYSSLFDRQLQNHVITGFPSTGEAMIAFSRHEESPHFTDESWNIQTGKNTFASSPYHQIGTMDDPTFNTTNYNLETSPFVQTFMNHHPLILMGDFNSNNAGFSKELSLTLATSKPSDSTSCSSSSPSLSVGSYRSPILSGSRFFHAMQQILTEIACYVLENFDQVRYSEGRSCERIGFFDGIDSDSGSSMSHNNLESKRKHLLSLLQAVDDQYNQCVDEIHTVISAFHAVTEMDPNLHARFALPTVSLMYRNLRERISSYILAMNPNVSEREDNSFEASFIQKQWTLQQLRKGDHQLWRPQRGLPERSVSVLRAWMFQNFLHPYPKDSEKQLLALKSGLTRSQVSNWFINARVRLWKPMIEEMYAEMNRRKAQRNEDETNGTLRNLLHFGNTTFTMD